jgi:rhamnosyltransferase
MEGSKTLSVGVVIVTLNAEREVEPALRAVLGSSVVSRCLVMDSSSTDGTVALAKRLGAEVHILPRAEFNHGATREKARKLLATDIVVLLTQDVIPEADFIAELIKPIRCGETVAAYSRQLPHLGAEFFEAFPREFNYPATGNVRSISDTSKHGVYAFFCSDSAAAYSNEALDRIGGFEPTLTNEDYFAVARLLRAGGRIAYVAESRVRHSHRYTLEQEFRRYFDTGYVRAENGWVNDLAGHAEGRGALFAREMFGRLSRQAPLLIPYAFLQTAVKWIGYRVGYFSVRMPLWWCRWLSSQRYYWDSGYCRHSRK